MSIKKKKYTVGDLVYITEQVHDHRMPDNRIGLVSGTSAEKDAYYVMFNNGQILKFHSSTLAPLSKYKLKNPKTGVKNG